MCTKKFLFIILLGVILSSCCWLGMKDKCECKPDECTTNDDQSCSEIKSGIVICNGKESNIDFNSVDLQGNILKLNISNSKIIDHGFVISTTSVFPTIDNNEFFSSNGQRDYPGPIYSQFSELQEGTNYYARVYIIIDNLDGNKDTIYNPNVLNFRTYDGVCPEIIISNLKINSDNSIKVSCVINNSKLLKISRFGFILSENTSNPDYYLMNFISKSEYTPSSHTSSITWSTNFADLLNFSKYYLRAFVECKYGVYQSEIISFVANDFYTFNISKKSWQLDSKEIWSNKFNQYVDDLDKCNYRDEYKFELNGDLIISYNQIHPCPGNPLVAKSSWFPIGFVNGKYNIYVDEFGGNCEIHSISDNKMIIIINDKRFTFI